MNEWRGPAPRIPDSQVEQNLVSRRALMAMFEGLYLRRALLFRGGIGMYKHFFGPLPRFTEAFDVVQVDPNPARTSMIRPIRCFARV